MKRAFDVAFAAVGLVVTAPLAYAALRIKLDSPGPVFFRQERLGLDMEPFTCLKFRTMRVDTDLRRTGCTSSRSRSSAATVNGNGMYKLTREDAVTSFGRWLRKTSLDELPQLINVLRGDMSIGTAALYPVRGRVLPAPPRRTIPRSPGITGLWQVSARANSTFGEALDMDVAYVHGWSLGLDLKLLFRTPFALLRQRRATA